MKYIIVYEEIKTQIEDETYVDGERLPSIRELASFYQCSIDTIKRALALLVENHYIYVKDRSGYFVLQKGPLKTNGTDSDWIDFRSKQANLITFPFHDFQLCLKRATETFKNELFEYGESQGSTELIQVLQKWFETQQLYCTHNNLFITTGVQQALFILSHLSFPNNKKTILVEMPSYHLLLDLLKLEHLPFLTISRDQNGIDFDLLEVYFRDNDIKFFYTTPRLSSPLGLSYSEKEKQKLVYLAQKYDVYLVEDDYLADYITQPNNLPLHYYDTSDHVFYLKSFSKIMFPGLRIGACILPKPFIQNFKAYRSLIDIDSSLFSQTALALYIKNGMFDHHIKQTKQQQHECNQAFMATISQKHAPTLFQFNKFNSCKSFLTLPKSISKTRFETNLKKQQVRLDDISRHFVETNNHEQTLYGLELFNLTPQQINLGMKKIQIAYENSL